MADRKKVFDALRNCVTEPKCKDCPWEDCEKIGCKRTTVPVTLLLDTLKVLKNEPSTSTEDTSYQRLMAINRDLIERNTKLAEEAQELAQFNDNLTKLCEALMKKVYADEKT